MMFKLNIQDCNTPKQHHKNGDALIVGDYNHPVTDIEKQHLSHAIKRLNHQEISLKNVSFENSKLKAKDIAKLYSHIWSSISNHFNKIQKKKRINWKKISKVKVEFKMQILEFVIR